jgi:AcrR family transcriptional regulator
MGTYFSEHEDTKKKILLAAKKEFAEKGFSGARMSSIAKNAGVNQALLHYYFSGKTNIYINVFQKHMGLNFEKYIKQFHDELDSAVCCML